MTTTTAPYIARNPGDLWTAEDWNRVQLLIKEDIAAQTQAAIDAIDRVPNADNADKLENKSAEQLTTEILERVLSQIPMRTGYRRLFKKLTVGEESVIEHGLKACPLVDIYQLNYFEVVASEDDDRFKTWVNFYLYHASEKRIRITVEGAPRAESIEIEPSEGHPYRIRFSDMLAQYSVEYTDDSGLDDLETEFWKAFFADPNDQFDDNQYTHSPWFDRCCREQVTVRTLKQKRDWDDLWFKMVPRKTVNYPYNADTGAPEASLEGEIRPEPTQLQIVHFDFDTLGLRVLRPPLHQPEVIAGLGEDRNIADELKVMLLLKV
jgi:hypothetical protein